MSKGSAEAAKTHCPQGHPYDAANTRLNGGSRFCIQCARDRDRARTERRRDERISLGIVFVPRAERTHCPHGHEYTLENTRTCNGSRFCRTCDLAVQNKRNNAHPERMMWKSAQTRARKRGVPFTITPDDIVIPERCPVLGMILERNVTKGPGHHSPSLDRIEASKGYVPGNIVVISLRANRIKNDASLEELERVTNWLRKTLNPTGE